MSRRGAGKDDTTTFRLRAIIVRSVAGRSLPQERAGLPLGAQHRHCVVNGSVEQDVSVLQQDSPGADARHEV